MQFKGCLIATGYLKEENIWLTSESYFLKLTHPAGKQSSIMKDYLSAKKSLG